MPEMAALRNEGCATIYAIKEQMMKCKSCGRKVQFPQKTNSTRYGYGWECRCGWFNKLSRPKQQKKRSYTGGRGCPACGSRNISQFDVEYDNRGRPISYMMCYRCYHTWRMVS